MAYRWNDVPNDAPNPITNDYPVTTSESIVKGLQKAQDGLFDASQAQVSGMTLNHATYLGRRIQTLSNGISKLLREMA